MENRILMQTTYPKKVMLRPVAGRAMQFHYSDDPSLTRELAEWIEQVLGVTFGRSKDVQCGIGYHLETGNFESNLLSSGDWIVVDSFGKAAVVKEKDFKVYYEPALDQPAHQ